MTDAHGYWKNANSNVIEDGDDNVLSELLESSAFDEWFTYAIPGVANPSTVPIPNPGPQDQQDMIASLPTSFPFSSCESVVGEKRQSDVLQMTDVSSMSGVSSQRDFSVSVEQKSSLEPLVTITKHTNKRNKVTTAVEADVSDRSQDVPLSKKPIVAKKRVYASRNRRKPRPYTHYTPILPSVATTDVRRTLLSLFQQALNSGDRVQVHELLTQHCHPTNFIVKFQENVLLMHSTAEGTLVGQYIEVHGVNATSLLCTYLLNAVPDGFVTLQDSKFDLLDNKHSIITCQCTFRGTKALELLFDKGNFLITNSSAVVVSPSIQQQSNGIDNKICTVASSTTTEFVPAVPASSPLIASIIREHDPLLVIPIESDYDRRIVGQVLSDPIITLGVLTTGPCVINMKSTVTFLLNEKQQLYQMEIIYSH